MRSALILAASLVMLISTTAAATNSADSCLALTARALTFMRDRHLQNVRIALVRDPTREESAQEAEEIHASLSQGTAFADMHLTVLDISIDKIESANDIDVFWITKGMKGEYGRVASVANKQHALSVSSDLDCAQQGLCVLGVQAEPSVKIILSANAASEAGISFQPAFRMMVTER